MSSATVSAQKEVLPDDVPNLVPGAEKLGFGYNIFGTYSFDNAIRPLFDLGAPSPWSSPSGATFNLPANVTTPGGSKSSASAYAFSSMSEFSSYFQRSASVSGSIGAFSASFSTSYSTEQQNSNAYSWALVESDVQAWEVGIEYSPQILLGNVVTDPDWLKLPTQFNPSDRDNVLAFFRFFQKFGTHFISSVTAGGTLYYYFAVSTSSSYSSQQISMSASAEYHGLISSTSVEASQNWGQTASNWTQNRQSHAVTVPATAGIVDWVNPLYGTYDQGGNFAAWKNAVATNPSRTKFTLTPIWMLFSGDQWSALQLAYAAYASNRVTIDAWTGYMYDTILVNGTPYLPPGGFPSGPQPKGWHLVVLDSETLTPHLNRFYPAGEIEQPNWPDPMYDQMSADMGPYVGNKDYMLVAATSGINDGASPNDQFYGILKSFGGGAAIDRWYGNNEHGCAGGNDAYALVGLGGSSTGVDAFTAYSDPSQQPGVRINALLLPIGGSFSPTPYSP